MGHEAASIIHLQLYLMFSLTVLFLHQQLQVCPGDLGVILSSSIRARQKNKTWLITVYLNNTILTHVLF